MPSLDIIHYSKSGDLVFSKDIEVYSGTHPLNYWEQLHQGLQYLKETFANILRTFSVTDTKFGCHPNGGLSNPVCKAAILSLLRKMHHFFKQCGEFYEDFEKFVEVANRSVAELVHRFNHQATVNYKGFSEFETLVDDCMDLINNDSCFQSRIKFQRAMATHMELLGKIKNFRRITANQMLCVNKAQSLVDFSQKISPFLDMVRLYIDRLCERDEVVCSVGKIKHQLYSCHGHDHFRIKRVFSGVCSFYSLFKSPAMFAAKIQEYDDTLASVDREAKKSEWILEHFYKNRLLPVQESLHENIVWREKALGEGIICD